MAVLILDVLWKEPLVGHVVARARRHSNVLYQGSQAVHCVFAPYFRQVLLRQDLVQFEFARVINFGRVENFGPCVCISHSIEMDAQDWWLAHQVHGLGDVSLYKVYGQPGFVARASLPLLPSLSELILIKLLAVDD